MVDILRILSEVRKVQREAIAHFGIKPTLLRASPELIGEFSIRFGPCVIDGMFNPGIDVSVDSGFPANSFCVGFITSESSQFPGFKCYGAVVTVIE
jgi:hypothetical protein